jgi:hypothetical protein
MMTTTGYHAPVAVRLAGDSDLAYVIAGKPDCYGDRVFKSGFQVNESA